jgi:hypothetical protein
MYIEDGGMPTFSLRNRVSSWKTIFLGSFLGLIVSLAAVSAQAQTIFCPSTINGVGGFALAGGLCTNGNTGAVSAAALSSQALGDIQQSMTQQTTTATLDAISARRKEEAERCPEGFERSNDPERTCRRITVATPASPASSSRPAPSRPAPRVASRPAPMPVKAPPLIAVDPGYRFGVWAHAFGDYERRNDSAANTLFRTIGGGGGGGGIGGGGGGGAGSVAQGIAVDLTQTATTGGVIGGGDVTFRNLLAGNDGLILGILAGYVSTDISLNGTTRPTAPITDATIGTGTSTGKIRVSGPSVGGYYTYFNGPFSNDTTVKADFLSISESFTEVLAFNGAGVGGPSVITGAGSANVTNFVAASNYQYRFPMSAAVWVEPTVGYRYTNSSYDAGAAALGLQDGYDWRVQGGARLGIESFWNSVHVTTTITGLAYSDVKIVGGPITSGAGGAFAGTTIPSDQGKVRGEGIFLANFDYGRGFSTFVQAEVRGGSGLIGGGGRVGARLDF